MTQMIMILEMLATIALLSPVAKRLRVPLPILLVICGTILGFIPGLPNVKLDPELVFFIFLPPLLYIQACLTSVRDLRNNAEPISLLAIGLVLVTQYAVAVVAHVFIPNMGWPVAYVLGAIVSPTDAVAATSICQNLGVPRSIINIIEGESLVNDATGIVIYRLAVVGVLTGLFTLQHMAWQFIYMGVGGILIGMLFGWMLTKLRYRINDTPVEITVSLLSPFLIYLPAELLGLSGVLAVVAAGLYLGWHGPEMMNSTTRVQWWANWSTISFLLNGMVFLLIGMQLKHILAGLKYYSPEQLIGWAFAISITTILARLFWTLVVGNLRQYMDAKDRRSVIPWRHRFLVGWAGMRGVVSLAAALALPLAFPDGASFPFRDLLIFLTFSVIVSTLVVQGLSLPFIIRILRVVDDGKQEREEVDTRIKMARAAVARLEELVVSHDLPVDTEAVERLRDQYRSRIIRFTTRSHGMPFEDFENAALSHRSLERELVTTERKVMIGLRKKGIISDDVLHILEHELDLIEERLLPEAKG